MRGAARSAPTRVAVPRQVGGRAALSGRLEDSFPPASNPAGKGGSRRRSGAVALLLMTDEISRGSAPEELTAQAAVLAEQGHWERAFSLLLSSGDLDAVARFLEKEVFGLLSGGEILPLRAAIRELPPTRRSVLLRVADADAAMRAHCITRLELETLASEVEAAAGRGEDDYRWWVKAICCEYFFWKGDIVALGMAEEALREIPLDPLPATPTLVARGRLRRIEAVGHMFSSSREGLERGREALDAALLDFARAGWDEERSMTSALFATVWTAVSWDDVRRSQMVVREAADRLRCLRSSYSPLALMELAFVSFVAGDMTVVHAAVEEAEALGAAVLPAVDVGVRYVRAVARLVGSRASPESLRGLAGVGLELRAHINEGGGYAAVTVPTILAGLGQTDTAREWLHRAEHCQMVTPYGGFDRRAMLSRLGILERADLEVVTDLESLLDEMEGCGLGRDANVKRLRAARDCERVGLVGEAERLRARGVGLLPPPDERTLWEALFAQPLGVGSASVDAGGRVGEIAVLSADLEVRRGGRGVPLPAGTARLLAVLVAERRPVTVDRLADLLWPEVDLVSGRNRLNVVVHRLRKSLDLGSNELLVRGADGVGLDLGSGWRVDSWEFWESSRGTPEQRKAALGLYGDDFCARQLAYDDTVATERERLRARWIDLAAGLLAEGHVDPVLLAERVLSLDVDDERLLACLADSLEGAGRPAEAASVLRSGR